MIALIARNVNNCAIEFSQISFEKYKYHLFFCFPDARVRGKHSAWMSTHDRAEARTHYTQKNGAPKPSSGRKGDRDSGGRSPRDFQFARILLLRALLQSPTAPAPSRREPFVSLPHKNNTAKEKSLVVLVISPLRMQRRPSATL